MTLTRPLKNGVLCFANTMLLTLIALKLMVEPGAVGRAMAAWAVVVPAAILATLFIPVRLGAARWAHAALFACTGAAIGLTLGQVLRGSEHLWVGELLWLPIGIAAAVLHYWPSAADPYRL